MRLHYHKRSSVKADRLKNVLRKLQSQTPCNIVLPHRSVQLSTFHYKSQTILNLIVINRTLAYNKYPALKNITFFQNALNITI